MKKKKKYKLKWKNIIKLFKITIFFILFLIILIKLITIHSEYKNTKNNINKLKKYKIEKLVDDNSVVTIKPTTDISKFDEYWNYSKLGLIDTNFNKLNKYNKNVTGWIQVNGTNINYPILKGKYYINHSIDNKSNKNGWIYSDNTFKDINENIIIYGNNNIYNLLFGELNKVFNKKWNDNSNNYIIRLCSNYNTSIWQIVSVYHNKNTNIKDDIINSSEIDFNTYITENDKILTLISKDKTNNIIMHAKLIKYKQK